MILSLSLINHFNLIAEADDSTEGVVLLKK